MFGRRAAAAATSIGAHRRHGGARLLATSLLALLAAGWGGGHQASAAPQTSRPEIVLSKVMDTAGGGSDSIRLARDPSDGSLYYVKRGGEIYRIDPVAGTQTLVADASDHGQTWLQGFAIGPRGTFFLVNNEDVPGTQTRATIVKGVKPAGSPRIWSILARTDPYPRSATAYDHRFNGIIVDPSGSHIIVNSGSRTDHGEVQTAGGLYPDLRESGLTACILRLPTSAKNLLLRDDRAWLRSQGYIFAEGTRNTFDFAFAPNGDLFGTENGPGRDDPEELNWMRPGLHYGFPWRIGGHDNPMQFPDYDPASDRLLNPFSDAVIKGYYYNDPNYPARPQIPFVEPIRNLGPNADKYRDPVDGKVKDANGQGVPFSTFTPHRSPLGLIFDRARVLAAPYRGSGFMLSWTKGSAAGDQIAGPFKDPGQDLLQLALTKAGGTYTLRATRIVGGFNNPIDAEIVGNDIYVLEYGGQQSLWRVHMPQ